MRRKLVLLLACLLFQMTAAFAAVQMKVIAINEFKTDKPSDSLDVRVVEATELGKYNLGVNSTLHCKVIKVIEPKRGKRNASFFVQPLYYIDGDNNTVKIEEEIYGKYSKFVLSKEELKKIPPFKVMKTAALAVGNYFIKGLSIAYSFGEGVVKNEQDNRLKSGVTNAYESSPLSIISEGEQLDIKVGEDWKYEGMVTTTGVPTSTLAVKYEFVGLDWSDCGTGCTRAPKKIWNKYTRSVSIVSSSNTIKTPEGVVVECNQTATKEVEIFGVVKALVGYEEIRTPVYKDVYKYKYRKRTLIKDAYTDYKWSIYNDQTLLDQGYTMTGNTRVVD